MTLNQETCEMKGESSSFRLGNLEFEMLVMLIKASGKEIEAERFIEKVWDGDGDLSEVKLYISYLRKKMDTGFDQKLIHNVWGTGWVLKEG